MNGFWEDYGCNLWGLIVLGIDYKDNDAKLIAWDNKYGVKFPSAGKDGGADVAESQFTNMGGYPAYRLISPERKIVAKQNGFPFYGIKQAIDNGGVQEHDCDTPNTEIVLKSSKPRVGDITIKCVSTGKLSLSVMAEGYYSFKFYASDGRIVNAIEQKHFTRGTYVVGSKDYRPAAGMLFVEVRTGNRRITEKVLLF